MYVQKLILQLVSFLMFFFCSAFPSCSSILTQRSPPTFLYPSVVLNCFQMGFQVKSWDPSHWIDIAVAGWCPVVFSSEAIHNLERSSNCKVQRIPNPSTVFRSLTNIASVTDLMSESNVHVWRVSEMFHHRFPRCWMLSRSWWSEQHQKELGPGLGSVCCCQDVR